MNLCNATQDLSMKLRLDVSECRIEFEYLYDYNICNKYYVYNRDTTDILKSVLSADCVHRG